MSDSSVRASSWQLREQRLEFQRQPALMGIVNVTPDSFSDGGRFFAQDTAVEHALRLADQGAAILDIGGESTRPYSTPVDAAEEAQRVVPVIERVARQTSTPISIDTSKASVAERALDAGAEIINDVTGLEGDPSMPAVAARSKAGICAMHMQGTPQTMQDAPTYADVVDEIYRYLQARLETLISLDIDPQRVCFDPGIGFGKTHDHNITLMQSCGRFLGLGRPILVGHSRKGFIAKLIGDKETDRTAGTIGGTLALAAQGVQIIRIHDVAATRQALAVFEASGGLSEHP